ncbi:MAG: glycosyltransferase [Candidatus Cloacimonetes bacterium]|nr:glycosyltransferase [Candidatus Cloacimonadota bacterium]
MRPEISVIMAVYNREKYLRQAIASVLAQSYDNWELIIIDDGSTDKSMEIASSFADSRIRIYNRPHKGCWHTKNYGISISRGKWILFLDSDDFLSKDYIKLGMEAITTFLGHEYYYPGKFKIVQEDGSLTDRIWRYREIPFEKRELLIHYFMNEMVNAIPHPGSFIKREVFFDYGAFDGSLFNFGDMAYTVQNGMMIDYKYLQRLEGYYNRQHSSQTNKNFGEKAKVIARLMQWVVENYPPKLYIRGFTAISNKKEKNIELHRFLIRRFTQLAENAGEHGKPFVDSARIHYNLLKNIRGV